MFLCFRSIHFIPRFTLFSCVPLHFRRILPCFVTHLRWVLHVGMLEHQEMDSWHLGNYWSLLQTSQPPIDEVHQKSAVAISGKEWLCLTPVQSFDSNVRAMRFKKNHFGDPSWKMNFENMPEIQVLKALCVKKRATPRMGRSLVFLNLRYL